MTLFSMHFCMSFYFSEISFSDPSICLKSSPPVSGKNIQSFVRVLAGSGPKLGKTCVYLVLCMVLPGGDALARY